MKLGNGGKAGCLSRDDLVHFSGVFCECFDCAYHDVERAFYTTLWTGIYARRVCSIFKFLSAKCAAAILA